MVVSSIRVAILKDSGHEPFPESCPAPVLLSYYNDFEEFIHARADIYIDFPFQLNNDRVTALQGLQPALVMINAVSFSRDEIPEAFIRFNGWPGFSAGGVLEIAGIESGIPELVLQFLMACGLTGITVPGMAGFVRPRVLAMIINEAFYALGEGVSTQPEIDTAMKLGTNYPYGPFEWAGLIGLERIKGLLEKMAEYDPKYQPAPSLVTAAQQGKWQ